MKTRLLVAAVACALTATIAGPVATASADNDFTCRASAVRASLGGSTIAEPSAANRGEQPCAADAAGVPDTQVLGSGIQQAQISGASATTSTQRDKPFPADLSATASAGVTRAGVIANPAGGYVVNADAVNSTATAICSGNTVGFTSSSNVATVTLGGQPINLNGPVEQVFDGISGSPLGSVIKLKANQLIRDGNTLTRRALQVTVTLGGTTVADVVIGESKVGAANCSQPPTAPQIPCEAGSVYNASTGTCVRNDPVPGTGNPSSPCPDGTLLATDGTCFRQVFTPVSGNSSGVTVISLAGGAGGGAGTGDRGDIPGARLGPCKDTKKFPAQLVFLGTPGNDRITGTKDGDIVLADAGSDTVNGGGGNDCLRGEDGNDRVDGGTGNDTATGDAGRNKLLGGAGNDRLLGSKGNDQLFGESGNDTLKDTGGRNFLVGGSGNNRITGGAGRDYITTASGRNVINGGRGADQVNAAKAGKATRGTCGPGRDTVRLNPNEMHTLRGCERRFVVRRV